jgi:DNA-binding transcriptional MerR regulator
MENLMPIGEFASASRLSQKALRLYGENGLLSPAWVDPDSGYRYYRLEQLREATLIALLRRGGMSLAEVRRFLRDPTVARLEDFERRVADDFAERRRVLRYVKRILKEEPMYDVLTKQVGEQAYVSRSKRVYVRDLESFICSAFTELGAELETTRRRSSCITDQSTPTRMGRSRRVCRRRTGRSACRPGKSPSRRSAAISATSRRSSAPTSPSIAGPRSMVGSPAARLGRSI